MNDSYNRIIQENNLEFNEDYELKSDDEKILENIDINLQKLNKQLNSQSPPSLIGIISPHGHSSSILNAINQEKKNSLLNNQEINLINKKDEIKISSNLHLNEESPNCSLEKLVNDNPKPLSQIFNEFNGPANIASGSISKTVENEYKEFNVN